MTMAMSAAELRARAKNSPASSLIDPNVKLPAAVVRASELAEQRSKEINGEPDNAPPPDALQIPDPNAPPPAEPPAEPQPQSQPQSSADTPDEQPKKPVAPDSWEHKFLGMQGRFNAERQRNTQLADRVAVLEGMLADMQSVQASAPAPVPPPVSKLVTDKDLEDYGPDMIDLIGRRAQEIADVATADLRAQVADLSQRVQGTQARVERKTKEDTHRYMDEHLPNWKELNSDQAFLHWVALPDVYSGVSRKKLLNDAYQQFDAPRMLRIFQGFLSDEAASAPALSSAAPSAPQPQPQPKVGLEQFAAPGRARTPAAATAPAEKPFIKSSEITAFYTQVRTGHYAGRDDEKNRLEAEIFAAQREGRVLLGQ